MNTPALLVVVRHAESLRNSVKNKDSVFITEHEKKKLNGYTDSSMPLTPKGIEQARKLGRGLASDFKTFDIAFHSGYARAESTLSELRKEFPRAMREQMKIEKNVLIRERDTGYTSGMTQEETARFFPFLQEYWERNGSFFTAPPGGESLAQTCTRIATFYEMLCRTHAGKNVLVVTHGGVIACFSALLEKKPYDQVVFWKRGEEPGNCNVTAYKFLENSEFRVILKNHIF